MVDINMNGIIEHKRGERAKRSDVVRVLARDVCAGNFGRLDDLIEAVIALRGAHTVVAELETIRVLTT